MLLGAEYSIPVSHAVDAAVFYDAGTVGPQIRALGRHLNADYGVGVRLHSSSSTLARLDIARSSEGTRLLFTFSAPFAAPSRHVVPYVP
jgi:outer membrane translocation and assembly module TamA